MKTQIPQATLFFLLKTKPSPQVLLGRKKRGLGKGKILGVGGKVESGENILGAALREVREEISVTIPKESAKKIGELTFLFPHQPSWSQKVHVFTTTKWNGTPRESEELTPIWFPIDKIPYDQMWDDGRYWLPKVLAGEIIKAEFLFDQDNKTVQSINFFDASRLL